MPESPRNPQSNPDRAPASYVSVVAWSAVVLATFASIIFAMQIINVSVFYPPGQAPETLEQARRIDVGPNVVELIGSYGVYVSTAFLAISIATVIVAFGLLRRRPWALAFFTALMYLGGFLILAMLVLQQYVLEAMPDVLTLAPLEFQRGFRVMGTFIEAISLLLAGALGLTLGWVVLHLKSPAVAAEFERS